MARKGTTKARKPKAETVEQSEPIVCQFCGDKGYIELDKIGLVIKPCYNCEKGIARAREIGVPEDVIEKGKLDANSNSGTGQVDSPPGGGDTG